MRRYGRPPQPQIKYTIRPGAYAILPRRNALLLTWQGGDHNELQLPGGGIDPGEGAITALHREVFEETGWRIAQPRLITIYRRFVHMPEYDMHAEKVCHIYMARPIRSHGPPREADHTAVWASPVDAVDLLASAGDRAVLAGFI